MQIYPDIYIEKVEQITIDLLKKNDIKALILDVDNTLIDHKKNLSQEIINWSKKIKQHRIKLYILSNSNKKNKVKKVAEILEVPYIFFAKKPLKGGFKKIAKILNISPENIGVVGDQIFTDILGGNRCKMFTILVDQIDKKEFWYTIWKRPIEDRIKRKIKKVKI